VAAALRTAGCTRKSASCANAKLSCLTAWSKPAADCFTQRWPFVLDGGRRHNAGADAARSGAAFRQSSDLNLNDTTVTKPCARYRTHWRSWRYLGMHAIHDSLSQGPKCMCRSSSDSSTTLACRCSLPYRPQCSVELTTSANTTVHTGLTSSSWVATLQMNQPM
jgi:hypothetical protein